MQLTKKHKVLQYGSFIFVPFLLLLYTVITYLYSAKNNFFVEELRFALQLYIIAFGVLFLSTGTLITFIDLKNYENKNNIVASIKRYSIAALIIIACVFFLRLISLVLLEMGLV